MAPATSLYSTFELQLQGLQGFWKEKGPMKGKLQRMWYVCGDEAFQVTTDGHLRSRRVTLTEGICGNVIWGGGSFALDPNFTGLLANWITPNGNGGKTAFSWTFVCSVDETPESHLHDALSTDEEVQDPREGQKRIDPADGEVYSWAELKRYYSETFTLKAIEAYWDKCWELWSDDGVDKTSADGKTKLCLEKQVDVQGDIDSLTKEQAEVYWEALRLLTIRPPGL